MEIKSDNQTKKELNITIKTPKGDLKQTFSKTNKVSAVINYVVQKLGLSQNGQYELRTEDNPTEALQPERTLVSYKIEDCSVLVFVDFGKAV
ncbi:hypothetical protein [Flagellimonas beolgyonensis]|uniref:hypothetical protein n=1 Tax=Flagellimonas beolgyonensis TaxID=864064 RepID=UPI000F8E3D36|nr:hypothetical protein [Allomuricauda beolgyonensis]